MPHRFRKHFTVEEAAALVSAVRSILEEVGAIRRGLAKLEPELAGAADASGGNGGGHQGGPHYTGIARIRRLIEQLTAMGVQLKDPDRGLVDFPHLRAGREVFLCWMLGEDGIEFWHDLDAGFAGRQPL